MYSKIVFISLIMLMYNKKSKQGQAFFNTNPCSVIYQYSLSEYYLTYSKTFFTVTWLPLTTRTIYVPFIPIVGIDAEPSTRNVLTSLPSIE